MITKYLQFINENWQVNLNQEVKSIIKSVITKDEIEDVFLGITDAGGRIIIDYKSGYFDRWLAGIGRKSDLTTQECYPFILNIKENIEVFSFCDEFELKTL